MVAPLHGLSELTGCMVGRGGWGWRTWLVSNTFGQILKELLLLRLAGKAEVTDLALETQQQLGQVIVELSSSGEGKKKTQISRCLFG